MRYSGPKKLETYLLQNLFFKTITVKITMLSICVKIKKKFDKF